ncbi:MAG: AraC family transcriptional regulator [Paludibacteraceae bacterium]|nr:AraC family transcriptional regulator [Paludibacteraceae bacterium]
MEQPSHPVLNAEEIVRRGVIIAEVDKIPTEMYSLKSESMVIGLCMAGTAEFEYNMTPTVFEAKEIGVTLPNMVLTYSHVSEDYRATLIIISRDFFESLTKRASFVDYKKYYYNPAHRLTDGQFEKVQDIMRVLRIVCESEHPMRTETLKNLLDLLFYTLTRYRGEEGQKSHSETRDELLFSRFYDLLIVHYPQHHNTRWYAEQLCLSPKYFSKLIKDTTNKSAAEWVDIVLIMNAKRLLKTRRDLTIQQVSYELGFSENASFCRFFKDHTGLRPREYREP